MNVDLELHDLNDDVIGVLHWPVEQEKPRVLVDGERAFLQDLLDETVYTQVSLFTLPRGVVGVGPNTNIGGPFIAGQPT
jgi:hypothetical protein